MPDSVRTAASNVLVALARTHFTLVMAKLQGHLKAVGEMSKEFALITLSKLFSRYAPQCIPFMWLTLAGLCSVVGQSLTMFLEALEGVQSVIPKDKFLAVTSAVFYQLSDDTKQHSEADSAELTHCILLQGKERSFGDAWRCPGQNLSHKPAEWVRLSC
ncbi:hypothetical protein CIB84_005221 [Bambusicola thoracicus]|uniref:MROH2B-like N-terminal HEAT-repeats domain-containing protein n=1 Tax=Bambusicola thoracicus TaxID=9083 RepID=A0A2P4T3V2_BAMTH|nr:hypothetical protein CIB84_005221 [Bambusicola thoracicus]